MRHCFRGTLPWLALAVFLLLQGTAYPAPLQPFSWKVAAPESQGMSSQKLAQMKDALAGRGTKALLIIRNDRIVQEWYGEGFNERKPHFSASLAKALVGGLSLMLALNDGLLNADDPAWKYVPVWKDDPLKSKITIRHLVTHSSGIEDAAKDGKPAEQLTGWKGAFWRREPDPFSIARDQAPVLFEPGTSYAYSNPGMAMLAYCVTAALRNTPYQDIRTLLRERIMKPIGIGEQEWSIGYASSYRVDGLELVANWGGASFTPRAVARIGRLLLQKGNWEGKRLIDPKVVQEVLDYAGMPIPAEPAKEPIPASGLGWYTNSNAAWPKVPRDAFGGAGAGNQVLLVVPSLSLIIVRNGSQQLDRSGFWNGLEEYLFNPTVEALIGPPYPKSSIIKDVHFAPVDQIVRKAIDSDNWPLTWGDDDALYTSYGDGRGFEPWISEKLSQGFARLTGPPEDFRGENIRSVTGERQGDGPTGAKASGILMVNSVLYLWSRNTHNSTLAWSADHGKTWTWGFTFSTSFGSPTFLNFGKNYSGARDEYVYVYSQDGPSAYESDDQVVLARVPKDQIRDRGAYEFFQGFDRTGNPRWTREIEKRVPVFTYQGHCQRLDVVYNPAIKRYMMAVGYGHNGGWGLFDAPQPWGPWTIAFDTQDWQLGQTHSYRLPSKWISEDGRTMYLVFSGRTHQGIKYDAFSVRKMELELY